MKPMTPKVGHYLNRTVMVSVPALFDDGACRPFTLLGAELHGLWLQSEELTRRLLPKDQQDLAATPAAVFVPFAQIAGVLVAAPAPGPRSAERATSAAARGRTRAGTTPKDSGAASPKT
jgi:hypothetical protein